MVGALASNITCASDLTNTVCGTTSQTVGAIIAALILAAFLLTAVFLACTVYTRSPVSAVRFSWRFVQRECFSSICVFVTAFVFV
jgi:hypothetical protein